MLPVDDLHTLYYEQSGNPAGVPVVFVHGGPGGGAGETNRQWFDPAHYRIVLFDQRGCGRSLPFAETRQNTTALLVQDMEALRIHLGIEKWHLFGGSWGSTLSLAYAQAHPARCLGLVLRGIFLMREQELDWFWHGAPKVFPEAWTEFISFLPEADSQDPLEAYYRMLHGDDVQLREQAAKVWNDYESKLSTLLPNPQLVASRSDHGLAVAKIEAHYFRNERFTPHDALLRNIDRMRHIPGIIVQGRYDMVCPIATAYELAQAWTEADFVVVPDAGHASREPGMERALIAATEKMKTRTPAKL